MRKPQGSTRFCRNPAILAMLAAALVAGTPALPQTGAAGSEIERFCSNIADAARDRRYALQAKELQSLQAEIDQRLVQLEQKRAEYEEWLERRQDFIAMAEENVVQIYSKMRPDAAAERMEQLRAELAAAILMKLNARQAGIILNEMDKKSAAVVTSIMASAARRQDPS
jgi:flagellar motility protein MotE (MotC chaperone)